MFTRGPVDGRSRSGRYLGRCRQELLRHLGDDPSPVQRALVERIARMQLQLSLLDERAATGAELSAAEHRAYVSLTSATIRAMRALGLKGAAPLLPTLADIAERIIRRREAAT